MENDPNTAVETALETELHGEQKSNRRTLYGGAIGLAVWMMYIGWASTSVATVFDEDALAAAASGYVVGQVPVISGQLHETFVTGADEVVKEASAAVLARVPSMREELEGDLFPAIDQAASALAEASVEALVEAGKEPETTAAIGDGPLAVVSAALSQLPEALDGAMDVPDEDGRTPRDAVGDSLVALRALDSDLAEIAGGGGDPMEREFIVAWVDLLQEQGAVDLKPEDVDDRL